MTLDRGEGLSAIWLSLSARTRSEIPKVSTHIHRETRVVFFDELLRDRPGAKDERGHAHPHPRIWVTAYAYAHKCTRFCTRMPQWPGFASPDSRCVVASALWRALSPNQGKPPSPFSSPSDTSFHSLLGHLSLPSLFPVCSIRRPVPRNLYGSQLRLCSLVMLGVSRSTVNRGKLNMNVYTLTKFSITSYILGWPKSECFSLSLFVCVCVCVCVCANERRIFHETNKIINVEVGLFYWARKCFKNDSIPPSVAKFSKSIATLS